MNYLTLTLKIFAVTIFTLALATAAHAQNSDSWVSTGLPSSDANDCSRPSPCATFAGAITKTNAGGTIHVIEPGTYGPVTINKAITIDGQNVGIIFAAGVNGINVAVGINDTVIIRNLKIIGNETNFNGINYTLGGLLVIDNVTIERFAGHGFFANGASSNVQIRAEISRSHFQGNKIGVEVQSRTNTAVHHCVISGTINRGGLPFGVNIQPAAGTTASIKLEENEIAFNHSGIRASGTDVGKGNSKIWARNNVIYDNTIGLNVSNAGIEMHSAGGNVLYDNGTPISGSVSNLGALAF